MVAVDDLDRILDRHDVLAASAIDVVDHGRERRRLARAGRARDEDEPAVLLGQAPDAGREGEIAEVGNLAWDHPEGDRDRAPLPEAVDAEARQAGRRVGTVELSGLQERL